MKKNQRRIKSGGIDALDETVDFEYGEYIETLAAEKGGALRREREREKGWRKM